MATPKLKGAPASDGVRQKKPTKKEKSEVRKARRRQLLKEIRAEMPPPAQVGGGRPPVVKIDGQPRPTEYDEKLAFAICRRFATDSQMSLSRLNLDPALPDVVTFYDWLEAQPTLYRAYTRAREIQADVQAEELKTTAANALKGVVTTRRQVLDRFGNIVDTVEEREADNIERAKLIVSTQQWLLAKLRPKKYGVAPVELEANDALKDLLGAFRKRSDEIEGGGK